MLDRWWPHVVAMSRVLRLTVISGADGVSFSSQTVSFGMLVVPTLAPWGTIGQFGGQEGRRWDPGLDSIDFGTTFSRRLAVFGAKYVFSIMRVYR